MKFYAKLLPVLATYVLTAHAFAAEPIKIGVAGAHSGDLASYGLPTARAAQLVAEAVNAKGGIKGSPVELLLEDDTCKPEVAANTAAKLVSAGVKMVIGHICSGATKAALPIYTDAGVIVISPSATDSDLTLSSKYPTFHRTIGSNNVQAAVIVDFLDQPLKAQKIAIIHDKGDYGKGLAEDAQALIRKDAKGEVVLFEGITPGAVDYSAIVQKIKLARADAVIYGGYHPEASKIITQMRRKQMKTLFISDDGVKDATFLKVAGQYAEGVYATGPSDVSGNPITQQYRKAYTDKYGETPGAFFDNAVAATLVLINAAEQAATLDATGLTEALRTHAAATPFGELSFDAHGDASGVGYTMYTVKDGAFAQVK